MACIVASVGSSAPDDWRRMVVRTALPGHEFREVQSPDALARLGVVGPGATLRTLQLGGRIELFAVGAGTVDGEKEVAAAVLDAFVAAGASGLTELRGEYAFALWDGRTQALFVGCDPVGLRAPAYTWDGRVLRVSSRAIGLLTPGGGVALWDPVYLAHALSGLRSRPAHFTAFQRVRRIRGGEMLRVSPQGLEWLAGARFAFESGWHGDREDAARELGARLDRAVSAKATASGTCIALSGGVDSCVVATALAKTGRDLDAFSLVAPERCKGESDELRTILRAFPGARHHLVDVGREPRNRWGPFLSPTTPCRRVRRSSTPGSPWCAT